MKKRKFKERFSLFFESLTSVKIIKPKRIFLGKVKENIVIFIVLMMCLIFF